MATQLAIHPLLCAVFPSLSPHPCRRFSSHFCPPPPPGALQNGLLLPLAQTLSHSALTVSHTQEPYSSPRGLSSVPPPWALAQGPLQFEL